MLDAFSRLPLMARVFLTEPTAEQMARLLRRAARSHGTPKYFISDQGPQFTAEAFARTLGRLGIRQRFGTLGQRGAIATMERFWRTLKSTLHLRRCQPLLRQDLERRLHLFLFHYAFLRPHQGLGGATPAEVHLGLPPARPDGTPAPRGRPGEGPQQPPFEIAFLDPERRLPYLVAKAA